MMQGATLPLCPSGRHASGLTAVPALEVRLGSSVLAAAARIGVVGLRLVHAAVVGLLRAVVDRGGRDRGTTLHESPHGRKLADLRGGDPTRENGTDTLIH